jgi:membrane protease subunit HflK
VSAESGSNAQMAPSGRGGARRRIRWLAYLLAAAAVGWYLGSGIFAVNADEQGVVRRFGALVEHVGPGIHYRLPWPIDQVDVLKTTTVMKIGVGFTMPEGESQTLEGTELLTGDTNILNIALVIQYVIRDPADYLFHVSDPQALVSAVAQAALTQTVVSMPVDEVLTTGRLAIQNNVRALSQATLDTYRSGVQITSANIMSITFDKAVASAFQEAANAMADREKVQNEAQAYANDQLPRARGEAHRTVTEAENYKQQRVAEATGTSKRFLSLLEEYEKAPDVTRQRVYLEAMERLLPKVKLYVIDSQGGRIPLNLRISQP